MLVVDGLAIDRRVLAVTLLRDGDNFVGAEGPELRWHARVVLAADGPAAEGALLCQVH